MSHKGVKQALAQVEGQKQAFSRSLNESDVDGVQ